jgi:hypothetical protein
MLQNGYLSLYIYKKYSVSLRFITVITQFRVTIATYSLLNDVDIIKRIKINRSRWAGHVIWRENAEIIK